MQFLSFGFLPFLAAVLAVYYLVPGRLQWVVLLCASYGFFLRSGPENLLYILLTTAATYAAARGIHRNQTIHDRKTARQKNKPLLLVYLVLALGLLFVCKLRLTLENALLPLGISFYLFQSMGYVLDVYRGTAVPEGNIGKLALFLSYFPQLVQGPISRYSQLAPQLFTPHSFDRKHFFFGTQRMLWGYFKKLVIADRIAPAVKVLLGPEYTGVSFLALTLFYAVQIYGDFTGGIDIALGLSEAMGFSLPENFDHPYGSKSIAEYWRRWHITLGQWMKDYVFYPVSISKGLRKLSRLTQKRWPTFGRKLSVYAATVITWLCTGIWHGLTPNFLLWGLLNCFLILLSEVLSPRFEAFHRRFHLKEKPWYGSFQVLRTFFLMNLIRSCDLFPNPGEYFRRLGTMFSSVSVPFSDLGLTGLDVGILLSGILLMAAASRVQRRKGSLRELLWQRPWLNQLLTALLFLAVLLLGRYGIGYDAGNFIYNQF